MRVVCHPEGQAVNVVHESPSSMPARCQRAKRTTHMGGVGVVRAQCYGLQR